MMKRLIALLLCLLMCVPMFAGCAIEFDEKNTKKEDDDKGAYITMYLTDEVYNFDPALAFNNEEAESIVSLLFTRLFSLDKNGKLQYELAKSYTTAENEKTNEYTLTIKLNGPTKPRSPLMTLFTLGSACWILRIPSLPQQCFMTSRTLAPSRRATALLMTWVFTH